MKKVFLFTVLFFAIANTFSQVYVSGYFKSNGTYVMPHYRSSPNNTVLDNYSTKGNINPYTGSVGTKSVYDAYSTLSTSNYSTYSYSQPSYSTKSYTNSLYYNSYTPSTYSSYYSTPSYKDVSYSTNAVYTGPRGGTYYINSNGNKTYIKNK